MYHGKMTARMYNIWSLAYRTHSFIFVRHRYDLLCVLLCYTTTLLTYFFIIASYHFYLFKCSVRPSDLNVTIKKGTIIGILSGSLKETWGNHNQTIRKT